MKSTDYLQLPPLIDQDWVLELPEETQKQYKEFEKEFFLAFEGDEIEAFSAGAKSMKCRQLANGAVYTDADRKHWSEFHSAKLDALEEIIEELNGSPVLVCYQFIHDKERILRKFPEAVFLDSKDVASKVHDWNEGEIKILVGHPASMGHGLNLQYGGNHVVWFGIPWALELYEQAIGRLLRNGQKGETVINHRLITKGTIEEAVVTALESKDKTQAALREAIKQYRLKQGGS
jgi:SNF2 family DNA or RNA helicase